LEYVGCSVAHVHGHLENQFENGMSWDNYGEWHIDHMMPCAYFDHNDEEQVMQCWHWTNLKPEWGTDNIAWGDKIKWNMEWVGDRWVVHGTS
jgi:hypothetical protein